MEALMAEDADRRQVLGARINRIAVQMQDILIFGGLKTAAGTAVIITFQYFLTRFGGQPGCGFAA
jgi:hypothetical protein